MMGDLCSATGQAGTAEHACCVLIAALIVAAAYAVSRRARTSRSRARLLTTVGTWFKPSR